VNHSNHYAALICKAIYRQASNLLGPLQHYERHHIIPRSQRGPDHPDNLVWLTPKEHYTAHLLLWKMGDPQQIFSVKCFIDDAINVRKPHRFAIFRWKRWLRRAVQYQYAKNIRMSNRVKASQVYNKRIKEIDETYVEALLDIAGTMPADEEHIN
jgi:hypothetical protein